MTPSHDSELNCRGLACPLPVIKAQQRLRELAPGQVLRVIATDPEFMEDIATYVKASEHHVLSIEEEHDQYVAYLVRGW